MRIELKGVGLRVGAESYLYPLDLALQPGAINVLLGPTRAGKTSLMRVMAGLDQPSQGQVIAEGRDVTGVGVRRRNLAMVYQQFINYPSFKVFDNIASPLRLAGKLGAAEIEGRVREVAKRLHIEQLLDRLPAELSGGQQQRTAIARALAKGAELLLLDEPLVNLDYKLREELRVELRELFAASGTTVVYATTEPQEALLLGGHVIVMDAGRVLQAGQTVDVFHHPASTRVAEIFSDPPMNLFDVVVEEPGGRRARLSAEVALPLDDHLAGLPAGAYRLGVRPGHVRLAARTAKDMLIPAQVELAEISGSDTFVHARHGDIVLVAQAAGVHAFALGQPVTLCISPAELFAFDAAGALLAAPDRNAVATLAARPAAA